jgi:two-component sensor histidine kinase
MKVFFVSIESEELSRLRRENASIKAQLAAAQQRYDEVCHRIKNELQVFSALFAAQRRQCGHPEHCDVCISRICATAALHNVLDTNEREICRLGSFVRLLSDTLHSAFENRFESIVTVDGDFEIDCARAKCIGLVVVEATINALKYGLPGSGSGRIETRIRRSENEIELVIENDGEPFPLSALSHTTRVSGKGLKLMSEIAEQLGGALVIAPSAKGTAVRLTFPLVPPL